MRPQLDSLPIPKWREITDPLSNFGVTEFERIMSTLSLPAGGLSVVERGDAPFLPSFLPLPSSYPSYVRLSLQVGVVRYDGLFGKTCCTGVITPPPPARKKVNIIPLTVIEPELRCYVVMLRCLMMCCDRLCWVCYLLLVLCGAVLCCIILVVPSCCVVLRIWTLYRIS